MNSPTLTTEQIQEMLKTVGSLEKPTPEEQQKIFDLILPALLERIGDSLLIALKEFEAAFVAKMKELSHEQEAPEVIWGITELVLNTAMTNSYLQQAIEALQRNSNATDYECEQLAVKFRTVSQNFLESKVMRSPFPSHNP
jgi:hypothetical protein